MVGENPSNRSADYPTSPGKDMIYSLFNKYYESRGIEDVYCN